MKKVLSIVIIICLLTGAFATVSADYEDFEEGIYKYRVSDGVAVVMEVDKSVSGKITVPKTLGGYPVKYIGSISFVDCDDLTGVTIPEGVTAIWGDAFESCDNLKSVSLPDSLEIVDARAFCWCEGLEKITIPKNVTEIGARAFVGCKNLKEITIPNSVKTIGNNAFEECLSLKDIYFQGTSEEWEELTNGSFKGLSYVPTVHFVPQKSIVGNVWLYAGVVLILVAVVLAIVIKRREKQ